MNPLVHKVVRVGKLEIALSCILFIASRASYVPVVHTDHRNSFPLPNMIASTMK